VGFHIAEVMFQVRMHLFVVEELVAAEEFVPEVVLLGLFAGRGLGGVVADEGVLVEHGLVAAQEGVVVGLLELADLVSDGQTHVEDPAAGADVGVVAVGSAVAVEVLDGLGAEDVEVPGGELVGHPGGGDVGEGGEGGEEQLHLGFVR